MLFIPGKYQHYKNENIDDYFAAVGVPFMGRKMMSMSSPLMEITYDGEIMTIKNSSLLRTVEHKFKLGEEYEEHMPNTIIKPVTNYKVLGSIMLGYINEPRENFSVTAVVNDNEMETKSVIPENGAKCGRHYLFSNDECVVTLTHEKAKTPGKRYFRRIDN